MMLRTLLTLILCSLVWLTGSQPAGAHGTGNHIMGTVTGISDTQLDLTTKNGKPMSLHLTDKTTFQARGKDTTGSRPQVGDRVVVDATGQGDSLTATEVLFAHPPQPGKAAK